MEFTNTVSLSLIPRPKPWDSKVSLMSDTLTFLIHSTTGILGSSHTDSKSLIFSVSCVSGPAFHEAEGWRVLRFS